jgi:hypothetical protein
VVRLARFLRPRPGLGDARRQDEVLAERVAFEVLGEEEVVQGRVALEDDAEHLVRLAFVPGRARVDADGGGERRGLVGDGRTDEKTTDRGQGHDVGRDAETRARFVDRAQPVEVGAAQVVAGGSQGGEPGCGRYVDRQELVRLLGGGLRTEQFLCGGGQPADGGHRASPEAASESGVEAGA